MVVGLSGVAAVIGRCPPGVAISSAPVRRNGRPRPAATFAGFESVTSAVELWVGQADDCFTALFDRVCQPHAASLGVCSRADSPAPARCLVVLAVWFGTRVVLFLAVVLVAASRGTAESGIYRRRRRGAAGRPGGGLCRISVELYDGAGGACGRDRRHGKFLRPFSESDHVTEIP